MSEPRTEETSRPEASVAPAPLRTLWAKAAGGVEGDYGSDVVELSDGVLRVVGSFGSEATFGLGEGNETTLLSNGNTDAFVATYGHDGRFLAAMGTGGAEYDRANCVVALPDDDWLMGGAFGGIPPFGSEGELQNVERSAVNDGYVVQLSSDGSLRWSYRVTGRASEWFQDLALTEDGIATIGGFHGSAQFLLGDGEEVNMVSEFSRDMFVGKLSFDGELLWVQQLVCAPCDPATVVVDGDGSLLMVGATFGSITFYPGEERQTESEARGWQDAFVTKFSPDGDLVWVKQFGDNGFDEAADVALFDDGSLVVTGSFEEQATFGPGEARETVLTAPGVGFRRDAYVARLDPNGELRWVSAVSGEAGDSGSAVVVLADGTVVVAGVTLGVARIGEGARATEFGSEDAFTMYLAAYTGSGELSWVYPIPGIGTINRIIETADGDLVITGNFSEELVFDSDGSAELVLQAAGEPDAFIAKLGPDPDER